METFTDYRQHLPSEVVARSVVITLFSRMLHVATVLPIRRDLFRRLSVDGKFIPFCIEES